MKCIICGHHITFTESNCKECGASFKLTSFAKNLQDFQEIIIQLVDEEVHRRLANDPAKGQLGFCHVFWSVKQRILKEKLGIYWKTPAEENPFILYD